METTKQSEKHYCRHAAAKARRERAIERLEKQLKTGFKPPKKTDQTLSDIPLMDKDITRINKELEILRSRI